MKQASKKRLITVVLAANLSLGLGIGASFAHANEGVVDCPSNFRPAHLHDNLAAYILGMDRSSLEKAARGALMPPGLLLDKGSGSGKSAFELASMFPRSKVVGADLDPGMTAYAQELYSLENLSFLTADVSQPMYPEGSVNGIFFSSVLHHLSSFHPDGSFSRSSIKDALKHSLRELALGGILVVRDFVEPNSPDALIDLEIPTSEFEFFQKFASQFRSSTHLENGIQFTKSEKPASTLGMLRIELQRKDATEYILHKDYKDSFESEIKEEYTLFTAKGYLDLAMELGYRVLSAQNIYNPWIIKNRLDGKLRLFEKDGTEADFPATNFVIAGQKVAAHEGVKIEVGRNEKTAQNEFLSIEHYKALGVGKTFSVARRPGVTYDLIGYSKDSKGIHLVMRMGFPRPIIRTYLSQWNHDFYSGYQNEIPSFIGSEDAPPLKTWDEFRVRSGITDLPFREPSTGRTLYTSPEMIDEVVTQKFIELPSSQANAPVVQVGSSREKTKSGFQSDGTTRMMPADQILRSAQVGGIVDPRLELAAYDLLSRFGQGVFGPWIGSEIKLRTQLAPLSLQKFNERPPLPFSRVNIEGATNQNLEIHTAIFEEKNSANQKVSDVKREWVQRTDGGSDVFAFLPVFQSGGEVFVGLSGSNLPLVGRVHQVHKIRGSSEAKTYRRASELAGLQWKAETRLSSLENFKLGGSFFTSPGVLNELIHPICAEVDVRQIDDLSNIKWYKLGDLIKSQPDMEIKDLTTQVMLHRLWHALQR